MLWMVVSRFYSHYVIIAHLAHELTSIRRCCLAIVFPQLLIRVMENTSSYSSVLHMVKSYHDSTERVFIYRFDRRHTRVLVNLRRKA